MTIKELRTFIESHEKGYYVYGTRICKAFKVEIANDIVWIWFYYGEPKVLSKREMKAIFPTLSEAKDYADKVRKADAIKEKREKAEKEEKLQEVTSYLENFRMYDITNWDDDITAKGGIPFVKAVSYVFDKIPAKYKNETKKGYEEMLERYIKTGVFYTQGLAFRKENVLFIKYGEGDSVQIKLVNGTKITPVSYNFIRLVKLVFGNNDDTWHYKDIFLPKRKTDIIEDD